MASQISHPLDSRGFSKPKVAQNALTIFVHSRNGDDNNPGTDVNKPMKTLAAATKRIQKGVQTVLALCKGETWNEPLGFFHGGPAWDTPTIVTSYGQGPRPVVSVLGGQDGLSLNNIYNVAIIGIALLATDRTIAPSAGDPAANKSCNGVNIWQGDNILIEDCEIGWFKFNLLCQGNDDKPVTNLTLRRNVFHDNWTWDGYSQGAYLYATKYATVDGNYFLRCGWNEWTKPNMYNHAGYVKENCDQITLKNHYVFDAAATGWQARSGGDISDYLAENFAIGLTWGLVNGGGRIKAGGVFGDLARLIFIGNKGLYENTGPGNSLMAKRGNALAVSNVGKGTITDMICLHDSQRWDSSSALMIGMCDNVDGGTSVGVHNLRIDGLYCLDWPMAIQIDKRYQNGTSGPNSINNVSLIRSHTRDNNGMLGLLNVDTTAPIPDAADPDRTPDLYVSKLGIPFKTYHEAVANQSADNWDMRLEPVKAINWILQGFSRVAAPVAPPAPTVTPAIVPSLPITPIIPKPIPAGRVFCIGVVDSNGYLRRQLTLTNGETIPLTKSQTLVFFRLYADVSEIRMFAQNAVDEPRDGQFISSEKTWPNCFFGGTNGLKPAFNFPASNYLQPGKHFVRAVAYRNGLRYGSHFDVVLQVT